MFLRPLTGGDPGGSSVASSAYKAAMEAASLRFAAFSNVEIAFSIAALKSNALAIVAILPVVKLFDTSDRTTLLRPKNAIGWPVLCRRHFQHYVQRYPSCCVRKVME